MAEKVTAFTDELGQLHKTEMAADAATATRYVLDTLRLSGDYPYTGAIDSLVRMRLETAFARGILPLPAAYILQEFRKKVQQNG